jgi:carbon-monoxide dehydrogenase medium subunit
MKPAPFTYLRPKSLSDAVHLLNTGAGIVKPLGGGQSLGPMLNLRLVRPDLLIDLSRMDESRTAMARPDAFSIGGAFTHAEIEDGVLDNALEASPPLAAMLRHIAGTIAHRAVRNRGTLAGSLCHADPAADWVLAMTALDARFHCIGPRGPRTIPMVEFMSGAFTTALEEGEVLTDVSLPRYTAAMRWGYTKFCRKTGDFAKASCALVFDPPRGVARIVIGALDGPPALLAQLAANVAGSGMAAVPEAAINEAISSVGQHEEAADRQLRATVVKRCLEQALSQALGAP